VRDTDTGTRLPRLSARLRALWASSPTVLSALILQLLALLAVPPLARALHAPVSTPQLAVMCGVLAAALSAACGLRHWWWGIQLLFAPAVWWASQHALPGRYYLLALLLTVLVFGATFVTRVPLYLSGRRARAALSAQLPARAPGAPRRFVDLGCGTGSVLAQLSAERPDMEFDGVELAPLPALLGWLRLRLARRANAHVRWGSLWNCDLRRYDVVYAFLSPVPMPRLWQMASTQMRSGTLFISSSFAVPGQEPDQVVTVDDLRRTRLLIWRM
jgi:SAM-dependent methyltransferase